MHASLSTLLLLVSSPLVDAYTSASTIGSDILAAQSLINLGIHVADGSLKKELATLGVSQTCSIAKVAVRREYSTLSNAEKLEYTNAVKCMMDKPGITPSDAAPGVRSRYDDFVATHINQTLTIHVCGAFLSWHRYFIWTWEQALRNECGYQGWLPYWNWGKSSQDPLNSPYFDGSEFAQAGNGVYEAHNATIGLPSALLDIAPGVGGGCVETGPYAGYMANISATAPVWPGVEAGEFLGYGPRCLRHDISVPLAQTWATDNHTVDLLTNPAYQTGIGAFQDMLQYTGTDTAGYYGLHQYGHFSVNGDPSGDFFNSPNDPIFWLHHGNIDRMWWIWQNQDPINRSFQIAGTRTMMDSPPSANATIEDLIGMGYNGPSSAIKYHVSSVGGNYCYIYV
ncbi:tyrosinase [Xylariales sp. PMI_506]|nr:tyrosinase [Xylariales sp. PMI_506]